MTLSQHYGLYAQDIVTSVKVVADVPIELQGHVDVRVQALDCPSTPCSHLRPDDEIHYLVSIKVSVLFPLL